MTKNRFFSLGLIAIAAIILSCSDDDAMPVPVGTEGFYIVNEGAFGNGNTSISFYDRTNDEVTNDLFRRANGRALGDQAQSIAVHNGKAYIAVQNSSKIEVVKTDDFSSVATISDGVESPRYFIGVSDTKGYVSDWGANGVSGSVRVIDLNTNKVSATIQTNSQGANRMLLAGNEVFLANSGGFGRDSTITVINTTTDNVSGEINLADNPDGMVQDANGDIWVTYRGYKFYDPANNFAIDEDKSTPAYIIKISTEGKILQRLEHSDVNGSSTSININPTGDKIYYLFGRNIYKMSITDTSLPSSAFTNDTYYGLSVDPITGNIIGCEAPDFNSSGDIDIYDANGMLKDTFSVGIGPNGCTYL